MSTNPHQLESSASNGQAEEPRHGAAIPGALRTSVPLGGDAALARSIQERQSAGLPLVVPGVSLS